MTHLSLSLLLGPERIREDPNISFNWALVPQELNISTVDPDLALFALLLVFVTTEGSKAPVLGDNDLLAAREFVLSTTKGFDGCGFV